MSLETGKLVAMLLETAKETYEHQDSMLDLVRFEQPDPGKMMNADNVLWRTVQQHAPLIEGWDLTGEETGIIEETYPAVLGEPTNDLIQQRADKMRDQQFWMRRIKQSALKQATYLNKQIAETIKNQGSLFYRSNVTSGFDFIGEAQAIMNERQGYQEDGRCFMFNDRDTLLFAKDLASRETIKGRPENTWRTGQIGSGVAEFDVFTGSFLPNLVGGADPAATVTGDQSFAPEAGTVNATTKVVTNTDYRSATLACSSSASYNVGDKITISNSGTEVTALGLADKTDTGQPMTFTVISKPTSTSIEIFPKPIALDDTALTTLEQAYANIDTVILNGATLDRLNTDASNQSNLFWAKDAIEVIGGTIPADLFKMFDGKKVVNDTMKNGLEMYMLYDGDIIEMTFRARIFTWYGITMADPSRAGVAVTY
jgi:hypothetical protein